MYILIVWAFDESYSGSAYIIAKWTHHYCHTVIGQANRRYFQWHCDCPVDNIYILIMCRKGKERKIEIYFCLLSFHNTDIVQEECLQNAFIYAHNGLTNYQHWCWHNFIVSDILKMCSSMTVNILPVPYCYLYISAICTYLLVVSGQIHHGEV